MNSDVLVGAVIGGVLVLIFLNRKAASSAGSGGGFVPSFVMTEAGGIAGPLGGGCGCGEKLCDVLTRY